MRLVIEAGYSRPTMLQKKVIPLVLKGKDIAVEAGDQTGKTAAYLLPLLHRIKKGKPGVKILILTATIESSRKIYNFFRIFANKRLSRLTAVVLGEEAEAKKEYKLLQRTPDIIIGTSQRIIDHIRRDNLSFQHLQVLVIESPGTEQLEYFSPDVHFILSKIPRKVQKLFFSPLPLAGIDLGAIIRHPVVLNRSDWCRNVVPPAHFYYQPEDDRAKEDLLIRLVLARYQQPMFIFCASPGSAKKVGEQLSGSMIKVAVFNPGCPEKEKEQFFEDFQNKIQRVAIFPQTMDLSQINFSEVALVINFDTNNNLQRQLKYIIQNTQDNIEIISFFRKGTESDVTKIQEMDKLSTKQGTMPQEEEVMRGFIKNIITHFKESEDPDELNALKKIIKKNVSLFDRSYFMAYLLKQNLSVQGVLSQPAATRGNTVRLFINIGKKRKVYPRDLIQLLCSALNADKSVIKEIKILDNYSFVEIEKELAHKAISSLNGTDFKGRNIAVNFARKKEKRHSGPYRGRSRES